MRMLLSVLVFSVVFPASLLGQDDPQKKPLAFEVASVKPSQPGGTFSSQTCHGIDSTYAPTAPSIPPLGRCNVINSGLKPIIAYAWSRVLSPRQFDKAIVGGPGWIGAERFDIDAKAEDSSATVAQLREMLQTLLKDRFKLRLHVESKETSGFALIVAKRGSKLVESKSQQPRPSAMSRAGEVVARDATLSQSLLRFLNSGVPVDGPVVDRTGLTGRYTFTLKWSPDSSEPGRAGEPPDPTGRSLFTALQEQLGLQLQPIKTTTEVLVIDGVEKPDPN
jgi:uncharacterized protein (TIGR03435 family)